MAEKKFNPDLPPGGKSCRDCLYYEEISSDYGEIGINSGFYHKFDACCSRLQSKDHFSFAWLQDQVPDFREYEKLISRSLKCPHFTEKGQ